MEFTRTVLWGVLGSGLLIAEVLTGTFTLLFFGLGALAVVLARWFGLDSAPIEVLVFSGTGALGFLLFRRRGPARDSKSVSSDRDARFQLRSALGPGETTEVEYQGAPWTIQNVSSRTIESGEWARVERVDGVRLLVHPEPK